MKRSIYSICLLSLQVTNNLKLKKYETSLQKKIDLLYNLHSNSGFHFTTLV